MPRSSGGQPASWSLPCYNTNPPSVMLQGGEECRPCQHQACIVGITFCAFLSLPNTICSSYFPANYKIYSHPTFLYRYFIRVDNATNARSRSLAPVKDIVVSSILLGIGRWRGVINLKSDAFEWIITTIIWQYYLVRCWWHAGSLERSRTGIISGLRIHCCNGIYARPNFPAQ